MSSRPRRRQRGVDGTESGSGNGDAAAADVASSERPPDDLVHLALAVDANANYFYVPAQLASTLWAAKPSGGGGGGGGGGAAAGSGSIASRWAELIGEWEAGGGAMGDGGDDGGGGDERRAPSWAASETDLLQSLTQLRRQMKGHNGWAEYGLHVYAYGNTDCFVRTSKKTYHGPDLEAAAAAEDAQGGADGEAEAGGVLSERDVPVPRLGLTEQPHRFHICVGADDLPLLDALRHELFLYGSGHEIGLGKLLVCMAKATLGCELEAYIAKNNDEENTLELEWQRICDDPPRRASLIGGASDPSKLSEGDVKRALFQNTVSEISAGPFAKYFVDTADEPAAEGAGGGGSSSSSSSSPTTSISRRRRATKSLSASLQRVDRSKPRCVRLYGGETKSPRKIARPKQKLVRPTLANFKASSELPEITHATEGRLIASLPSPALFPEASTQYAAQVQGSVAALSAQKKQRDKSQSATTNSSSMSASAQTRAKAPITFSAKRDLLYNTTYGPADIPIEDREFCRTVGSAAAKKWVEDRDEFQALLEKYNSGLRTSLHRSLHPFAQQAFDPNRVLLITTDFISFYGDLTTLHTRQCPFGELGVVELVTRSLDNGHLILRCSRGAGCTAFHQGRQRVDLSSHAILSDTKRTKVATTFADVMFALFSVGVRGTGIDKACDVLGMHVDKTKRQACANAFAESINKEGEIEMKRLVSHLEQNTEDGNPHEVHVAFDARHDSQSGRNARYGLGPMMAMSEPGKYEINKGQIWCQSTQETKIVSDKHRTPPQRLEGACLNENLERLRNVDIHSISTDGKTGIATVIAARERPEDSNLETASHRDHWHFKGNAAKDLKSQFQGKSVDVPVNLDVYPTHCTAVGLAKIAAALDGSLSGDVENKCKQLNKCIAAHSTRIHVLIFEAEEAKEAKKATAGAHAGGKKQKKSKKRKGGSADSRGSTGSKEASPSAENQEDGDIPDAATINVDQPAAQHPHASAPAGSTIIRLKLDSILASEHKNVRISKDNTAYYHELLPIHVRPANLSDETVKLVLQECIEKNLFAAGDETVKGGIVPKGSTDQDERNVLSLTRKSLSDVAEMVGTTFNKKLVIVKTGTGARDGEIHLELPPLAFAHALKTKKVKKIMADETEIELHPAYIRRKEQKQNEFNGLLQLRWRNTRTGKDTWTITEKFNAHLTWCLESGLYNDDKSGEALRHAIVDTFCGHLRGDHSSCGLMCLGKREAYMDNTAIIAQINELEVRIRKKITLAECKKIINGGSTSRVESYFSYVLVYAPKQQFYSFPAQQAREFCGLLDWNIKHVDVISEEYGKGYEGEIWHRMQWRKRGLDGYRKHDEE